MRCSKCPAWGIDNLGFRGCLIRNTIIGDNYHNYHCNRREKTILKNIEEIKQKEARSKFYKWINSDEVTK